MSEDSALIEDFLGVPNRSFASSDLANLSDLQSNTYNNQLSYDFLSATSDLIDVHEGFLEIVVAVTGGAAFASASPLVAFKGAVTALFRGITILLDGQTIHTEYESEFGTVLNTLLTSATWKEGCKDQLFSGKDYAPSVVVSGLNTAAGLTSPKTNYFSAAPLATANNISNTFNQGFVERNISVLNNAIATQAPPTTAGFSATAYIPLVYLSDFFKKCGLITNCRYQVQFALNTAHAAPTYPPMAAGTLANGTVETAPIVNITSSRLWYRRVKLDPECTVIFEERLRSGGFDRDIRFIERNFYTNFTNVSGTNTFTHLLDSAVIAPQRIWVWTVPTGQLTTTTWPSHCATGAYGIQKVQVTVANTPYFPTTYDDQIMLWDAFKDEVMPVMDGEDNGCQINWNDWVNTHRIYCFNISRVKDQQRDPNQPVNIVLSGSLTGTGTAVDFIYVIEKAKKVNVKFGSGRVQVTQGAPF